MDDEQSKLDKFLKWASSLGVTDSPPSSSTHVQTSSCLGHSLCISNFPENGGRGLAAIRDIKKGEMVLRVPKSALMTTDSVVQKDRNLGLALKSHLTLSSTQVLSVCLLAEMSKGRKSAWYPYLIQLPRGYDTLASFGLFETKALQVDDAIWSTKTAISKAEVEWKGAMALLKQLNLKPQFLSFKAWLWSSATISSRTLHVPWDDAGCLCPVGDFFNYAAPGEESDPVGSTNSCLDDSSPLQNGDDEVGQNFVAEQSDSWFGRLTDGGYEVDFTAYCFYAKKHYRKNEQVLLSYGTYTNLELLEHYGFLLNDNPNDKVFLPLHHDIFACHSWPADSLYIQHDGRPSFALLSALRLWATPPNQRKSVAYLAFSGSQLSPENEITVMKWIISNSVALLRSLPSTVEDDQLLLLAIDNAQQFQSLKMPDDLPSAAATEFCKFTETIDLRTVEGGAAAPEWKRVEKCMDRWKLAIQWRLKYKKTLLDCISFCSQIVRTVLPEVGSKCRASQDHTFPER